MSTCQLVEAFVKYHNLPFSFPLSTDIHIRKGDKHVSGSIDEMQRRNSRLRSLSACTDERLSGREATYPRDEVHGPLSGKLRAQPHRTEVGDHGKTVKKTIVRRLLKFWRTLLRLKRANVSLSRSVVPDLYIFI